MSPQFVDFNGDGHLDIVVGIFDGSPHVAFGDGEHWRQPEGILDREGKRIVMNAFWNFTAKKWDTTDRCDPEGGAPADGHLTSAVAMDWDHDGDFDLLLGDYRSGYVYLRRNEGSNQKPAFATRNTLVEANGKPLHVAGKVGTLRTIDWNADGKLDLLIGSMGDVYGQGPGGGVFAYLNTGDGKQAAFGNAITLVAPSKKGASTPTRPDSGLYMDAVDHDGDGDLDLLVGGYSLWTPVIVPLDEAQQILLDELRAQQKQLTAKFRALDRAISKAQEGLDAEAANKKRIELFSTEEYKADSKRRRAVQIAIKELVPGQQRVSFVWLYENRTERPKSLGQK